MISERAYWDQYYRSRSTPLIPSQFAVFASGECNPAAVVDIGCGSGRDSFWFASVGVPVLGVDASQAAVDLCNEHANGNARLRFIRRDVGDPELPSAILSSLSEVAPIVSPLVYARFFLHAITEQEQRSFLALASGVLAERGGHLAVEYRTVRDMALQKETSEHYRRFIEPASLIAEALSYNLHCVYSVEGFGFAKYKADDAYVARMIFKPLKIMEAA